jgi:para-nitrobenzyl esterase
MTLRVWAAIAAFGLVAANALPARGADAPTVRVTGGVVGGALADDVRVFKNIPFAAPPVGPLRWKAPAPVVPWTGVRDGTAFGPECVQPGPPGGPAQSEDCLTLNVWAPAKPRNWPVIFWIYGGGFVTGSASQPVYDGAALAKRGVIVVTMNYRLNVLGFMAHPQLTAESPDHTSGNYGLLDQVAALQWVRANIGAFGGDTHNVTIAGESAGAGSVSALLTMPLAKGLYARAIMESPPVFRPELTLAQAEAQGAAIGPDIAALRALPAAALLSKMKVLDPDTRVTTALPTGPIVDGVVVPADERTMYATKRVVPVPLIIGNNTDEGRFFIRGVPVKTLAQWSPYLAKRFGARADEASRLYPASDDASAMHADAQIVGDGDINWGARELARAMNALGAPVYRYVFAQARGGVQPAHSEELPFVFGAPTITLRDPLPPFTPDDQRVSDAVMTAWVQFATIGTPNGDGAATWPVFTARNDRFLTFGNASGTGSTTAVGTGFRTDQLNFIGQTLRR